MNQLCFAWFKNVQNQECFAWFKDVQTINGLIAQKTKHDLILQRLISKNEL